MNMNMNGFESYFYSLFLFMNPWTDYITSSVLLKFTCMVGYDKVLKPVVFIEHYVFRFTHVYTNTFSVLLFCIPFHVMYDRLYLSITLSMDTWLFLIFCCYNCGNNEHPCMWSISLDLCHTGIYSSKPIA